MGRLNDWRWREAVLNVAILVFAGASAWLAIRWDTDARGRLDMVRFDAWLFDVGANVQHLASGIAACSDRNRFEQSGIARALPPQSRSIPAVLPRARATEYTTVASDWTDDAFQCAGFRSLGPRSYQLQWVYPAQRSQDHYEQEGRVEARVDLDGDGMAEIFVGNGVACSPQQCTLAPDWVERFSP